MKPRKIPQYSVHNVRDLGYINWKGKRHYFPGKAHSVESVNAYNEFLRKFVFGPVNIPTGKAISITDLVLAYQDFAESHYDDKGHQSHYNAMMTVAMKLESIYHATKAAQFGPKMLKEFRKELIDSGNSRNYVNDQISRVKKIFKWAASEELIPIETFQALATVDGLRRGREGAVESPKRKPVPWEDVETIVKELHEPVRTMVLFHWHTGVRSQSVVQAHSEQFEIDQDGMLIWHPRHKTEHLDKTVRIPLGPKARDLISGRLEIGGSLFKTRLDTTYSPWSYRREIIRAQENLFDRQTEKHKEAPKKHPKPIRVKWTPHQLRHAKATYIRNKYGIEAAQAILGHDSLQATQIYSEARFQLAKQIAMKEG